MRYLVALLAAVPTAAVMLATSPAQAATHLPPCLGACTAPTVDGVVGDAEYANGVGYPLSNFEGGGPNGAIRMHLQGDKLYVGLRVPEGSGRRGDLKVYLDADRPQTSCLPIPEPLQGEDRRLTISYDLDASSWSVGQMVGSSTGWQPPGAPNPALKLWPTTVVIGEPAGDPGMVHAELMIRLRPQGASQSSVIADGSLGLAVHHIAKSSVEHMPGSSGHPPVQNLPCSWETLDFTEPQGTPLSMSVWTAHPADDELEDLVIEGIKNRELVCLHDVLGNEAELLEGANQARELAGLSPFVPVTEEWGWSTNMILSSRPVIDSASVELSEFNHMLWARVLTEAAVPPGNRGAFKAGEFIDVFCLAPEQASEMAIAADFIQAHRAPDRPAFVLGDFNQNTVDAHALLGLDALTPFEQANTWLSDVHDLATLAPPDTPGTGQVHIYALPPSATWPAFGIAQEPIVSAVSHKVPATGEQVGSPELTASAELIRTDAPGHWNPQKAHHVTYRVSQLVDHASGGCCADWFTDFIGFLGGPTTSFSEDVTPEGDNVDPHWSISTDVASGQVIATVNVQEWDTIGDDLYDVVPETSDWAPFFRITHASGLVERIGFLAQLFAVLGTFEQSPGGLAIDTTGNTGEIGTAFHVITADEID
ncbi:MAG TPA: hypothetical protein VK698_24530 [Kofleriaceae bacterium]|nr:hypothetical protein [Kofleriaceae bacterium]